MNKKLGLLALTGVLALASCGGPSTPTCDTGYTYDSAAGKCILVTTTGTLGTITNPNGYDLVVKNSAGTVVPVSNGASLPAGNYTATWSKPGYVSQTTNFTVTAGQTGNLVAPTLVKSDSGIVTPKAYYYIDADGVMQAIPEADLNNAGSKFVFYAWLENKADGVTVTNNVIGGAAPTADEKEEVAPLNTQNLAAAFVGYKAADGKVYPVAGAGVRWDIVEATSQTKVRFATADDGGMASGAVQPKDVNDQAMNANTWTNNAGGTNTRFPSSPDYPLNNATGVTTPDVNGFTWTALWIPDGTAGDAHITAVATINGTEINKTVLHKIFAPSPKLAITKTPATQTVNVGQDATFTVTVTNTGGADATNVHLSDILTTNNATTYKVVNVTGATVSGTGFENTTLTVPANGTATVTLVASASAVGQYCDTATISQYDNGQFGTVASDLSASACMTVVAPNVNIIKTLVDANGNAISSPQTVAANTPVYAKITVSNSGNAAATGVVVTDTYAGQAPVANYTLGTVTANPSTTTVTSANGGFTSSAFDLAPGATQTFMFPAQASADGTYCDNASASAANTTIAGSPTANVCFTVTSPNLSITKRNQTSTGAAVPSLYPGGSYQSVITVTNSGTGAATGVNITDLLGNNSTNYMAFGSGNYTITNAGSTTPVSTGTIVTSNTANTVVISPSNITLDAGQTITITMTSSVPGGTPAGEYCDVATATATNATVANNPARACVTVVNFVSTRTAMQDGDVIDGGATNKDPIPADGTTVLTLTSGISVEPTSNQGVKNNTVVFNFGSTDPRGATPGVFQVNSTEVYYDAAPTTDPVDGTMTSNYKHAVKLTEGVDYTVSSATVAPGQSQTINILATSPLVANGTINIGGVIWTRHNMVAPTGTAPRTYNSSLLWTGNGANDNVATGGASSEPTTTILPQ